MPVLVKHHPYMTTLRARQPAKPTGMPTSWPSHRHSAPTLVWFLPRVKGPCSTRTVLGDNSLLTDEAVGVAGDGDGHGVLCSQPLDYLNVVAWFVKIALLMRRTPIIPELPCELTLQEWPGHCQTGPPAADADLDGTEDGLRSRWAAAVAASSPNLGLGAAQDST
jgi:hypothetical protein